MSTPLGTENENSHSCLYTEFEISVIRTCVVCSLVHTGKICTLLNFAHIARIGLSLSSYTSCRIACIAYDCDLHLLSAIASAKRRVAISQ